MNKIPMTAEGYSKLQDELKKLTSEDRPHIISEISEARSHGDLSENAEYQYAKEQQSLIEGRIVELESSISRAEIIDVKSITGESAAGLDVGDVIVQIDPRYFRPAEVETLLGDPSNAKNKLGWTPEISVQDMCSEMVKADLQVAKRIKHLQEHGYEVSLQLEV